MCWNIKSYERCKEEKYIQVEGFDNTDMEFEACNFLDEEQFWINIIAKGVHIADQERLLQTLG